MKQGQINQVFMFIIAMFIIGAVALIGVRSIGGIMEDKCTADFIIFKDSLAQAISSNNDYGSVNYERLSTPCKYHTLCLVDNSVISGSTQLPDDDFPGKFIIEQSVKDGVEVNAFLIGEDDMVTGLGYIKQIQLEYPTTVTCIKSKAGIFDLLLKGKGRMTEVSEK